MPTTHGQLVCSQVLQIISVFEKGQLFGRIGLFSELASLDGSEIVFIGQFWGRISQGRGDRGEGDQGGQTIQDERASHCQGLKSEKKMKNWTFVFSFKILKLIFSWQFFFTTFFCYVKVYSILILVHREKITLFSSGTSNYVKNYH